MIRTFIAVELSADLREQIAAAQRAIKDELDGALRRRAPGARIQWVRPESMHVTLKFLGDVTEDSLGELEEIMRAAARGRGPFSLEVGGLGAFPDPRAPRVLWLGLAGLLERLGALAEELDRALGALGFPPERKAFQPHLTLARIKERYRDVGGALAETGLLEASGRQVGRLEVTALSLMKSDLKPSGAQYTRLAEVPLGEEGVKGER